MDKSTFKEGFSLCFENSERLFKAAEILEKQNEYPIANSLLILSSEEAAKSFHVLIKQLIPEKKFEYFDKSFYDHKHKFETIRSLVALATIMRKWGENFYSPAIDNLIAGKSKEEVEQGKLDGVDKMIKWFQEVNDNKNNDLSEQSEWWQQAKTKKENGFYVGFNNGKWESPILIMEQDYIETKKYVGNFLSQIETIYKYSIDEEFIQEIKTKIKREIEKKLIR